MKKKFKMPSSFSILFIILVIVAIATWIIPSGEYTYICPDGTDAISYTSTNGDLNICPTSQENAKEIHNFIATGENVPESLYTIDATYEYRQTEQREQGLWQIGNAPIIGFSESVSIALFILVIGGFIKIVIDSGALDAGILMLLQRFKNREKYLIPIMMTLFAIGGTTFGLAEETIAFYIILIPIFYRAGYDVGVGTLVIMLGAAVGVLASTINPFAIGVASEAAGVELGSGIVGRFILFVLVLIPSILFVMRYAKKVKENPEKSILFEDKAIYDKEFLIDENIDKKPTGAQKLILALFGLTFVLMVMSVMPWEKFGITIFSDISAQINNISFLNLGVIFGGSEGMLPFGDWFFQEITMLFLVSSIIVGIIAKKNNLIKDDLINTFMLGAQDMISVALIIGLARGIKVIMASSGIEATILYEGSKLLTELGSIPFIIGTYIFYIPLSFLIPSTSGLATASMPVMGSLGEIIYGSSTGATNVITAFAAGSGIINLITPTSGVVMGGLAIAKIPYTKWLKIIAPMLVILFIITCFFLAIISATNFTL